VKITYENDTNGGPGHGIFRINQSKIVFPAEQCRFSVRRSSDRQCLFPGGWQDAETQLVPDREQADGDAWLLFVGSGVVDQLDQLETYRLTLIAADGAKDAGILELMDIAYSPMRGGGGVSVVREKDRTPPPPPPVETPPPPPQPEPPVVPGPLAVELADMPTPSAAEKRPLGLWIGLGLLLLVLLGAAGWYFLGRGATPAETPPVAEKQPEPVAPAPEPEAKTEAPTPPAPEPAAEAKTETPPEVPPIQRARTFLRDKGAPQQALELSRAMPATPEGRDAAFLLLGSAAEGGLGEAMVPLARFYDPTDTTPSGTIQKDPEQAWRWYAKAKSAGQGEAQERMDALTGWLRQEADKGSAEARELLTRMR